MPPYRFQVGDTVLCRTGHGWEPGRVVQLDYSNPGEEEVHPYQVRMNKNGGLIYVPIDDDACCKRHTVAWWEDLLETEGLSDEEGVRLLRKLSDKEDLNARSHWGDGALHACIRFNWAPGVEALLSLRADPNLGGERHERPLNMATRRGATLAKMLLAARADPSLQDEDPEKDPSYQSTSFEERQWHRSALHYAVMHRSLELTSLFLEARADINQLDAQYKQPLHLAIEEKAPDVVDLLLASKADVNAGNIEMGLESYPLVSAAYQGDVELVQKLVAARSDINRQAKQGMTPLHVAARGRRAAVIQVLLGAKADVNVKAANGKTAGELVQANDAGSACLLGHVAGDGGEPMTKKRATAAAPVYDYELRKQLYMD